MHLEVPKSKKFREFSGEYLMIVISVVTALALEHAVEAYHHRHLAQEATERIEAELRLDQRDLERALTHNQGMQQRVEKLYKLLLDDMKRGTSDHAAIDHVLTVDKDALLLALYFPGVQHEAWDVAVANQAATYIEPTKLQSYAALYAHMRDVDVINNGSGNRVLDQTQWSNMMTDMRLGKLTPGQLLHILGQMLQAYGSTDGNLASLRDDFVKRMGPPKKDAAA